MINDEMTASTKPHEDVDMTHAHVYRRDTYLTSTNHTPDIDHTHLTSTTHTPDIDYSHT